MFLYVDEQSVCDKYSRTKIKIKQVERKNRIVRIVANVTALSALSRFGRAAPFMSSRRPAGVDKRKGRGGILCCYFDSVMSEMDFYSTLEHLKESFCQSFCANIFF